MGNLGIEFPASFVVLALHATLVDSSSFFHKSFRIQQRGAQHYNQQVSPELEFQIKLHAVLLWASLGFLVPLGILIIKVNCSKNLKYLFHSHVALQITAILLATAAAVLSIMNFNNSFNNTHQRIGLALYALIYIQPLIGFLRPHRYYIYICFNFFYHPKSLRGVIRARSIWYFVHWLLGTGITIGGITNIFIGLHAYREKTSTSVRLWTILFIAEIASFAFVYLLQDRWDYMHKQGQGDDQITPADHLPSHAIHKEVAFAP